MNKLLLTFVFLGLSIVATAQAPTVDFSMPSTACVGETVEFTNGTNITNGVYFLWNFGDDLGDKSESSQINPSHIYLTENTYTIKLTAQNSDGFDIHEDQIEILPAPSFTLSFSREIEEDTVSMYVGQSVSVDVNESLQQYKWYRYSAPDWVEVETGSSFRTSTGGHYKVWAANEHGCGTEDEFWVVATERPDDIIYTTIIVENNILTPNQDGINDALVVKYLDNPEVYTKPLLLYIYNKQGVLVYENTNYANDWLGHNSSGAELSTGTYYYVAKSEGRRGKTGYVDIIRVE